MAAHGLFQGAAQVINNDFVVISGYDQLSVWPHVKSLDFTGGFCCIRDDGTTHLILTPHELLEELAALVPPPRVTYPLPRAARPQRTRFGTRSCHSGRRRTARRGPRSVLPSHAAKRVAWATLLARVLSIDVTTCDRCGGRMRVIAALTEPASIRRLLQGVGLPAQPPPIAPPRVPPQTELEFSDG